MRKALLVSMGLIAVLVVLAFGIDSALAYSQYSVNKDATNCRACHGDFRSSSYTSLSDGQSWGNLHNLHRQTMLSLDCDACHGASNFPVVLDSSAGGDGLSAISCMGCHGRVEDNTAANPDFGSLSGLGAGLRQHHYNAGQTVCALCHQDANPANYTPVGENVLPAYYANPGNNHPNMPTDPCNLDGNEDFAGIAEGLDNDGDGFYDGNDTDCVSPDIAVSPPSINFGSVTQGTSSTPQNVTITNNGNADLSVTGIALSGTDAAEFSVNVGDGTGGTCGPTPVTVTAGNNCTVAVTFSPSSTGAKSASLDVDSDDPDTATASVSLSGTGTAPPTPDIAVSPLSLNFGDVTTGTSSTPQEVTISNTGNAALGVTGMVLSGTNAAEFSLNTGGGSNPCGSTSPTILAGGNCTVTVTMSPTTTGAKSASLDISSDDPDENPVNIALSGNGTAPPVPDITVSPLTAGFGTIQEGTTSDQTVTVTNDGDATLNIGNVAVADSLAAPFSIFSDGCTGQALTPSANCTITVRFSPAAVTTYNDSFDIPSDDPDENPVTVSVSGEGSATPVPDISLSPLSINFGGVKVGSSSGPQTVTISNVGTADLSVTAMAVSGTHAADFSLDPGDGTGGTCGTTPATVTAGGNCTVAVTFSPLVAGARSASLDIDSDDTDEPSVSVALSGTGTVPDINVTDSVAPAGDLAVDFGSVQESSFADQTVTVTNDGNATLNIGGVAAADSLAAPFSIFSDGCTGQALTPSANCTITVRFSPATAGPYSDSFDIPSDDPDENPVTVSVSGTGTPTPVPDIAVTDSAAPANDLAVPFGDVTEGTSSPVATVTIANQGTADLNVSGIALSGANASEFTLNTGGGTTPCGGSTPTVLAGGNCTVTVTFSPADIGGKSAFLDITSDDPDEATVSLSLTGNGTAAPVPDIAVTDSVAPAGDLQVPFGSVQAGSSAYEIVTVTNDGNADLSFTGIAQTNPLAEPFGISGDSCSGVPLAPAANCTILVRFTPAAAGSFNDSFEIESNDPDTAIVTVTVSGTGTAAPVPDIAVTDSVAPVDDLQVPFGNITEGTNSPAATVTIANQGSADLNVSGITLIGPDAGEFSLDVNGGGSPCGSAMPVIASGGSCTLTVTFSPTTTGARSASLEITSDDPDEAAVSVDLGGTGLSSGANNPPSAPGLVSPADGQVDVDVPVVFAWYSASDPDGDAVTYNLFICDNSDFTGCTVPENPTPIASAMKAGGLFAAGAGFILLGMALGGSMSRRKKAALLIVLLAVCAMLLAACSGGDGAPPVAPVGDYSYPVSGLSAGTQYYWKVVADDGMGGTAESATWSFTTR